MGRRHAYPVRARDHAHGRAGRVPVPVGGPPGSAARVARSRPRRALGAVPALSLLPHGPAGAAPARSGARSLRPRSDPRRHAEPPGPLWPALRPAPGHSGAREFPHGFRGPARVLLAPPLGRAGALLGATLLWAMRCPPGAVAPSGREALRV